MIPTELLGLALLVSFSGSTEFAQTSEDHQVKVEVQGKLRHGMVAIGGETTGTQITANGVTWELDLGEDEEHLAFAEKFDRKIVLVSGTLKLHKGVEIPQRWICKVCSVKAVAEGEDSQFIKVEFTGKLRDGVMAIGGETTGTTITCNEITWEVDLSKDQQFRDTAKSLHKKTAVLSGTLNVEKGVEIPNRWIVTASELKAEK